MVDKMSKLSRAQLAAAAVMLVSACSPLPHRDGTAGGDSATMLRLGDEARAAGDPATALPLYQRAYTLDSQNSATSVRVAQTFNQLGAYRQAGDIWASILRLEPHNYDALVGYGITLTALKQPTLALEHFERAHQIGETAALYNGMGVAHDMLGNAMQAQDAYRQGLKIAPNSMSLSNNLGLSLALSGSYKEAIDILERVAAMPGAGVRHRQNLALAYALAGYTQHAQTLALQDLDELAVQRDMAGYQLIAGMRDHAEKVAALGAQTSGGITAIEVAAR